MQYYFDPVSGRKFRSKKEVLYFLETGTLRKRIKPENPDADTPVSQNLKQVFWSKLFLPILFHFAHSDGSMRLAANGQEWEQETAYGQASGAETEA